MNCKDEKFMSDFSVRFDEEIKSFAENNLNSCHVFELGFPGEILVNAGFPKEKEIQFKGSILTSKENKHAFSVLKLKGLVNKLSEPVAVFSYLGDRGRNVIIDTKKRGKNYLVGIHFLDKKGYPLTVSSIRTVFPKDMEEWLHWFEQNKGLYVDKNKLQSLIIQQRINLADVNYLDLESTIRIIDENFDVNGFVKVVPGSDQSSLETIKAIQK